jgi:hypothetical protein
MSNVQSHTTSRAPLRQPGSHPLAEGTLPQGGPTTLIPTIHYCQ